MGQLMLRLERSVTRLNQVSQLAVFGFVFAIFSSASLAADLAERETAQLISTSQQPRHALQQRRASRVEVAAAAPSEKTSELEIAWWQSIGDSKDPREYEGYLKKFGQDGAFAPLARARVAALRAPKAPKSAEGDKLRSDVEAAKEALQKAEHFIKEIQESEGMLGVSGKMPLSRRLDIFRGFLGSIVDFSTMAKFVLGSHRSSISNEEFNGFLRYYEAMVLEGYTYTRGDLWDGDIRIKEIRPYSKDYLGTVVLKPRKGGTDEVALRIRRKPDSYLGFKIIDVIYKGVSLLVTQRADYAPILAREGLPGLIKALEAKVGYQEEIVDIPD